MADRIQAGAMLIQNGTHSSTTVLVSTEDCPAGCSSIMGPTSAQLGTAEAINNPKFHAGDQVVLIEGPHKYERGTFMRLKDDVKWADIEETNGAISSHPVKWMLADRKLLSYTSLTGREKE